MPHARIIERSTMGMICLLKKRLPRSHGVPLVPALLCAGLWFSPVPVRAQANPTRTYEGNIGGRPAELVTLEDYHIGCVSGYLLDEKAGRLMTLEETPQKGGDPLVIDVLDKDGMPFAALSLRSFSIDAGRLKGEWIDLHTRKRMPADFRRTAFFTPDADHAYDAGVLQASGEAPFLFRIHARRAKGEHGGLVDRIDIYDRSTGRHVQTIDHLILSFNGTATLTFADFNGDGHIDFYASRLAIDGNGERRTGARTYYLFDGKQFRNFAPLDALEAKGALAFPKPGWVEVQPMDGTDYDRRVQTWDRYRFVASQRIKFEESEERPF